MECLLLNIVDDFFKGWPYIIVWSDHCIDDFGEFR